MISSPGNHLFLIGTGRCGSSISYACMAMHPEFAWIPTWLTAIPSLPALSAANRLWGVAAFDRFHEVRFFPKPAEANQVFRRWDPLFQTEDATADAVSSASRALPPVVERVCWAQGRPRFLGKLVGRPVKVETLARVFPHARFVHVVRPLKPSTASLLQVEFYDPNALQQWPWRAVPHAYLDFYRSRGSPREIAAAILIQANMLELQRQLAAVPAERWVELSYVDFVTDPVRWIRAVGAHAGFPVSDRFVDRLHRRRVYGGADDKWRKFFQPSQIKHLEEFEALPLPPV